MKKVFVVTDKGLWIANCCKIATNETFILGVYDNIESAKKAIEERINELVTLHDYSRSDGSDEYIIFQQPSNLYGTHKYEIKEYDMEINSTVSESSSDNNEKFSANAYDEIITLGV